MAFYDPTYKQVYKFNNMPRADSFCYDILLYLMDIPRRGYEPPDDTPRSDIARMIFYDEVDCLDRSEYPLPTKAEKLSMFYKPKIPTPTVAQAPKGYRLFLQPRIGETQTEQKTELRVFPGELYPTSDYRAIQAIEFQILCGMSLDTLNSGVSRSYKLVLDIIRALNGVDIGGGTNTIHFSRDYYHYCRTEYFNDGRFNVGYYLTMATEFEVERENE